MDFNLHTVFVYTSTVLIAIKPKTEAVLDGTKRKTLDSAGRLPDHTNNPLSCL